MNRVWSSAIVVAGLVFTLGGAASWGAPPNKDTSATMKKSTRRVPFLQVFRVNPDGSLSPLKPIQINGTTMSPSVSLNPEVVTVGGVAIKKIMGHDLAIEQVGNTIILKGYY